MDHLQIRLLEVVESGYKKEEFGDIVALKMMMMLTVPFLIFFDCWENLSWGYVWKVCVSPTPYHPTF